MFSKDFLWGAATAAYQIEGAVQEDGRVLSTWDIMTKGLIKNGDSGEIACDHYHRMKEDVAEMKKMGLKSYRFSVSWCRVISDEKGTVNEKGLNFYKDLVAELTANGIEPMCTLFHWDLPMWVYGKGGWLNDDISDWFSHYVGVVVKALSDKVSYWMTMNEPQCFVNVSWQLAVQPPFLRLQGEELQTVCRNVLLAHGKAVEQIRKYAIRKSKIGFATTCSPIIPTKESEIELAYNATFSSINFSVPPHKYEESWAEAIILGNVAERVFGKVTDEQKELICQPLDFFGVNIYSGTWYPSETMPAESIARTKVGWPIRPTCLYWGPKFLYKRYNLPIIITENGIANPDWVMTDGKVHDPQRIDYLKRHLSELKRATDEGVHVLGYQHWSLMDNLEWMEGYETQFGLLYIDYPTQQRIWKDSAYFYADIIRTNGESL